MTTSNPSLNMYVFQIKYGLFSGKIAVVATGTDEARSLAMQVTRRSFDGDPDADTILPVIENRIYGQEPLLTGCGTFIDEHGDFNSLGMGPVGLPYDQLDAEVGKLAMAILDNGWQLAIEKDRKHAIYEACGYYGDEYVRVVGGKLIEALDYIREQSQKESVDMDEITRALAERGCRNSQTQAVKNWLLEGDQDFLAELAAESADAYRFAEALRDLHENFLDADENKNAPTGVFADLLNMALAEVDWDYLAGLFYDLRDNAQV